MCILTLSAYTDLQWYTHVLIDLQDLLYKVVYVYLLNHTDIRPVHHSLFDRKDCLGIHGVA